MITQMTLEAVRERIESLFAAYNAHDVHAMLSQCTEDVVWEDPTLPVTAVGREAVADEIRNQFAIFPDLQFPKEEMEIYRSLDHRDSAAARWTMAATMVKGVAPLGLEPTDKPVHIPGMAAYEFRDGLIARVTVSYDVLFLSEQLGLMSSFTLPDWPSHLIDRARSLAGTVTHLGHRILH